MKNRPSTSLIISTYNWPDALRLCLLSVLNQTVIPDEVIIADDGSKDDTKILIEEFSKDFPTKLIHVWQPDEGFQLAKIRNKAIAQATGEYIIQIDGDIIMSPHFIGDHIQFSKKKTFVRASRIYINAELSTELLKTNSIDVSVFKKGVSNFFSGLRIPFLWNYFADKYKKHEVIEIHGCNMAFWRKDAIEVNGYDEEFIGWGPEDKEFIMRLTNLGKKKRFIKQGGIAFHIYHKENSREMLKANEERFYNTINQKLTTCKTGVLQYL
ncbi:glycosyltransferase family 2 protein [Solitalea koreensis]|uniref:Glycosyl transferase family 2 n=1 Tax=Solitalea koreensis TaxID=543615 RepID=A0A521CGR8_9SPHI|nr:glycosyltransferase family 2 protein [Solitalea koreensis]SMO58657.1 Glycosyl transferase family 2 [Solitalea koreensis]